MIINAKLVLLHIGMVRRNKQSLKHCLLLPLTIYFIIFGKKVTISGKIIIETRQTMIVINIGMTPLKIRCIGTSFTTPLIM